MSGLERLRAPGLAALLRRNPQNVRRGAVGSIVVGIVLFVIASMTTPLASADPGRSRPATPAVAAVPNDVLPPKNLSTISGTAVPTVATKRTSKLKPAPASAAVIAGLAANGIPNVALNAYRVAAARLASTDPGCGIDWALLAGIGRVESDHGQFAGARLNADGTSTPRIIGPALNGVGNEYIPAPPNGAALDGDAKYTHALGPMQFIPQTWVGYGADANGDGVADVFNVNDAALGAARYLCAAGGNLRTHDGQVRAVLTYNNSSQYLAQVLALADAYRRGIPITGLPVGITTGPLAPTATGPVPPANPGGPTAVDRPAASKTGAAGTTSSGKPSPDASAPPSAPSPTPVRSAPGPTSTPTPGGTGTTPSPSPSPSPSPTKSCDPLSHLLGKC